MNTTTSIIEAIILVLQSIYITYPSIPQHVLQDNSPVLSQDAGDATTFNYSSMRVDISDQAKMVYRAFGEARADGEEAVVQVVNTMLCRIESGYGDVDDVLRAYYAPDFPVDDATVARIFGMAKCGETKYLYSLSRSDMEYLKISEADVGMCIRDTCFLSIWIDNR